MKQIDRNELCPCASGKKYKKCCLAKNIKWGHDEEGNLVSQRPLHPEAFAILKERRQRFIEKHGREPGPGDPLFEDVPSTNEIADVMRRAGLPPELIYAFEKTGFMVTEANIDYIPDGQLAEWDRAIKEYHVAQQ